MFPIFENKALLGIEFQEYFMIDGTPKYEGCEPISDSYELKFKDGRSQKKAQICAG